MELKKGVAEWDGWWQVVSPQKNVLDYLRRSVPQVYRQFDATTASWYVHAKYVDAVKQLMSKSGTNVALDDDPWAVLHLRPGAPPAIIKAVWKVLALELHPDRGGDPQQFIKAKAAYEKLCQSM